MQIQLIHRSQIDDAQWNARVAESGGGLPYALTDYLDIVTNGNWSALVGENYEAIFPLPMEQKLGMTMYLQPPFTQQLGLITKHNNALILEAFLKAIPNVNTLVHLKGNENYNGNITSTFEIRSRTNLILSLNRDYDEIRANYSKSLRKRIRKSKDYYDIVESKDIDMLVDMYHKEMSAKVDLNSSQYQIAKKLFHYLINIGKGIIFLAKSEDDIEGALFVIKNEKRIINLFGTSNTMGKKRFAMHAILNHIVAQNCNTDIVLDFEGSDLEGVKKFYQSFGPEVITYSEYYLEQLPIWYRIVRKLKSSIS